MLTIPFIVNAQTATEPSGSGTSETPYQISSLENLYWITANSSSWDKYFVQTANIDASATSSWFSGAGWLPIAPTSSSPFTGFYDGGGKSISNLFINRPSTDYVGLFGYIQGVSNGIVENLGIVNANITGGYQAAGALAGANGNGYTIQNCYSTGSVSGDYPGGLVGVGFISTIIDSYSSCIVSGNYGSGGFIEEIYGTTITNCYSAGVVNTATYQYGGFIAYVSTGTVTNCFWDTQTSGQLSSAAGTGKTTTEMKTNSTFLDAGWSSSTWFMDSEINDGYPYLAWQNPDGSPMPVELISFTAIPDNKGVQLSWTTATEVNNYGFEIEKGGMKDELGIMNWEKIGFVDGHGSTNAPKSYTFVDGSAKGFIVYRLKQIDHDGYFKYSHHIEVTVYTPVSVKLLQNYPNPFNPVTQIRYQMVASGPVSLKIFDLLGREVAILVHELKDAGIYTARFDATQLPAGMYVYELSTNNTRIVKKMLLLK
jgi:hypothetical protein